MRRRLVSLFSIMAFLLFSLSLGVGDSWAVRAPIKKGKKESVAKPRSAASERSGDTTAADGSPGQTNAKAAVLMEVSTGTVLFESNPDLPIEPASFTKILTMYLVNEAIEQGTIHLDDQVYISETAWRTGGSKMFVGLGTRVPLEELIKGIAVVSGNDACIAAAEHVSGSLDAFVEAMNRKAKELGMSRSHFLNPHGLPAEGQITTAKDMATLDLAYLRRFPASLKYHSMKEYAYNGINQYNRNHLLLKDPTVDGLKTGFVDASGYHLAATAQREGMRLLAVVMGAASPAVREREAMKLLNYGFRSYVLVKPFPEGQPVTTVKVWKGVLNEAPLYPAEAPNFIIAQASKNLLRWEVRTPPEVTAPLPAGSPVGDVVFYVSDKPQRTVVLQTREELALAGWFKRTWQGAVHLFKFDWKIVSAILGGVALIGILLIFLAGRKTSRGSRSFGR